MHFPEWQDYSYTAVIGTLTLWKKHTVCVIAILLTIVIACTCLLNFLYNAVSACSPIVTSIHCQIPINVLARAPPIQKSWLRH